MGPGYGVGDKCGVFSVEAKRNRVKCFSTDVKPYIIKYVGSSFGA